jgi:hypothetical protein
LARRAISSAKSARLVAVTPDGQAPISGQRGRHVLAADQARQRVAAIQAGQEATARMGMHVDPRPPGHRHGSRL